MALVAYDYDSSENEDEDEENSTASAVIIPDKHVESQTNSNPKEEITNEFVENNIYSSKRQIFSTLPESKNRVNEIVEDQIEDFIPKPTHIKKEKQKVKITIPSLSAFQDLDDEEPDAKKIKTAKGSGLISLLPPVKGAIKSATSFVPNVVVNKNKAVRKHIEPKKSVIIEKAKKAKVILSDAESDDDIDVPETFDDDMWEKVCGRPKNKPVRQELIPEPSQEILNIAPEPEKPYEGLDNKAFKELLGKSKRPLGNIKFIDINEEDIMADKDLWLAKSLTDPEMAPKAVIEDPVDPTRRRKHHITYLAQQAKANEQDLKNAWAASKTNRTASRSKYGF